MDEKNILSRAVDDKKKNLILLERRAADKKLLLSWAVGDKKLILYFAYLGRPMACQFLLSWWRGGRRIRNFSYSGWSAIRKTFYFFLYWQAKGRPFFLIVVERRLADENTILSRAVGDKKMFLFVLILAGQGQTKVSYLAGEATSG